MKYTALFMITMIAFSSAMTIKEQRLKAMSKLSYSSLFAEIESQISSGGPLSSILDTIDNMITQISTEQREHDEMWAIQ